MAKGSWKNLTVKQREARVYNMITKRAAAKKAMALKIAQPHVEDKGPGVPAREPSSPRSSRYERLAALIVAIEKLL